MVLSAHVSWRVSFKVRQRYWWVLCRQAKVLKVWPPHLQGPQRNPQSPRGSLSIRASCGHIWNWTWFLTLFIGLGKIYPPASTHQGTTIHFHFAKDLVLPGRSIQNAGWVRLRASVCLDFLLDVFLTSVRLETKYQRVCSRPLIPSSIYHGSCQVYSEFRLILMPLTTSPNLLCCLSGYKRP